VLKNERFKVVSEMNKLNQYSLLALFLVQLSSFSSCNKDESTTSETEKNYQLKVNMVNNALNGDLSRLAAEIELQPSVYDFTIESTSAKFGSDQTPWEGVFLYTHERIQDKQPAPNLMTSLNGINQKKTIDLSNYSSPLTIQAFMIPNVPTYDDSGIVNIKIRDNIRNTEQYLSVDMISNALNGDLGQIASAIELPPAKYSFTIESTTAKFGSDQTPWEGVFLYTHEKIKDKQPAPNLMTTLNGIGNSKIIDLSNYSASVSVQGFMVPNIPTYDDSGEVIISIQKID